MIMENNANGLRRLWFIRDFMINTQRPVQELASFLDAFDSCNIDAAAEIKEATKDRRPVKQNKAQQPAMPKSRPSSESAAVVHHGTTNGSHPRAKMVMAEFEGRVDYYGSITAAAQALNCTQAQLKYALKHNTTVNGVSVITVTKEEVMQMMKGKEEELV